MRKRRARARRPKALEAPAARSAWRQVDRLQLGLLLGVHPDTVSDYVRAGMPMIKRGGGGRVGAYDSVECLAWWRDRQGKNAKEAAQTRAFTASAELNELKLARERGELFPREQVVLEGQAYTKGWAAKVRALPRRQVQAGIITRELEPQVGLLCREILSEIASWRTAADATAGADGSS